RGEGGGARAVPQAARAGAETRRSGAVDPGARARFAVVPVPPRKSPGGGQTGSRLRLGAGQPAELLPLVVAARPAAARPGRRGTPGRPRGARRPGPADAEGRALAPPGRRVRLPVAARPRVRPAGREERTPLPHVRRPARRPLRGVDSLLHGS